MPAKNANLLFKQCKARQKALAQSFCGTLLVSEKTRIVETTIKICNE